MNFQQLELRYQALERKVRLMAEAHAAETRSLRTQLAMAERPRSQPDYTAESLYREECGLLREQLERANINKAELTSQVVRLTAELMAARGRLGELV